jgi:hypothetical protein
VKSLFARYQGLLDLSYTIVFITRQIVDAHGQLRKADDKIVLGDRYISSLFMLASPML